eukprot:5277180-Prymnesium_polylepis.1
MRPNGGLTAPCVRASQATRSHNDRRGRAALTHVAWAAGAGPIGALMQHGAWRRGWWRAPACGQASAGASMERRAQDRAMTFVE